MLTIKLNWSDIIEQMTQKKESITYDNQIEIFNSLGYKYADGITKEMILNDVNNMYWEDATEKFIEQNPFSILYNTFGMSSPEISAYSYTEKCVFFDLEFFDPSSQYKWFMERMGAITNGEITFDNISVETDSESWEWIKFEVNGIHKKWKLEKTGFIADHYIQRFSYLPSELKTKGRYTYFDDDSQQFVIDYATNEEQLKFNKATGLNREWLGEGNHFSEPKE